MAYSIQGKGGHPCSVPAVMAGVMLEHISGQVFSKLVRSLFR
jgi:hypothetical protein